MPITDIIPLIQSHAWVPLAALVIGFLVRTLKSDAFVLPSWAAVAAPYRPLLVLALGVVSGVLDAIVGGTPWRDALVGGLLSALMALIGHTTIVDVLRGGRDIGAPAPPAEKGPLYQPPAPRESEEVTLPRGPRGIARIDAVLAVCGALVILVLAQLVFGCSAMPLVIHVADEAAEVCPKVAVVFPEVGPVCLAIEEAERIVRLLTEARAAGKSVTLAFDSKATGRRSVVVKPEDIDAAIGAVEKPIAAARGGR